MIGKRDVILTSAAFLMFLLRKRKFWEEPTAPTSLHMKLVKNHTVKFYEIQPPNNYMQNFHSCRISVICQKQPLSFASSRCLWLLLYMYINVSHVNFRFMLAQFSMASSKGNHNESKVHNKHNVHKANDVYRSDCIGHT